MSSAFDVSAYIYSKVGRIDSMKLQKLVYYSQAWSLVWDNAPLFNERIGAWKYGPVCGELWFYKDDARVTDPSRIKNLLPHQIETIDAVLRVYGHRDSDWLSTLTHLEAPWLEARAGKPYQRGEKSPTITHESMRKYYASLDHGPGKTIDPMVIEAAEVAVELERDESPSSREYTIEELRRELSLQA